MKVIDGRAEIKDIEYLIDCAAHSSAPNDWSVHPKDQIASRVCGLLAWNLGIASLWLSEKQKNGKFVTGNELRKELEGQPVLNANVLDFLLEHTHLISEEWKGRRVFFWGTIYFDLKSNRYVRYLYWAGGKWRWHYFFLGRNWDVDDIAVVRRKLGLLNYLLTKFSSWIYNACCMVHTSLIVSVYTDK